MDKESLPQTPLSDSPSSIALTDLKDVVLHKTWSIRLLSPFVTPLQISGRCAQLEKDISLAIVRNRRRERDASDKDGRETSVELFWGDMGTTNGSQSSREGDDENGRCQSSQKRRKVDRERHKHFIIDVCVDEETSSQLVCCYPQLKSVSRVEVDSTEIIEGFDFLLTRGSKSCIDGVLSWLENATGCKESESIFCPSAVDLIRATTFWTTEHWNLTNIGEGSKKRGSIDDNISSDTTRTKPLTLTYQVPFGPVGEAGLESIEISVPPVSLLRLCNNIISARQQLMGSCMSEQNRKRKDDKALSTRSSDHQEESRSIPIVRALQCFLRENFRIHIEKFALIRASSSVGALGCDGRCKPLCGSLLHVVLSEIRFMTLSR